MSGTIWKFAIPFSDEFEIEMPRDAELLFVGLQNETGQLWARVDPLRGTERRKFKLRGTGHPVDSTTQHVGSFIMQGGALVFHLFEDREATIQ